MPLDYCKEFGKVGARQTAGCIVDGGTTAVGGHVAFPCIECAT